MKMQFKYNKQDMKEKMIVAAVTTGIFLPARLIFYTYVSQYWLGSLGLVSLMAVLLWVLVKKNKLGKFGQIFQKQMALMARGKIGKSYIAVLIIGLIFFGGNLFLLDRGENYWHDDRKEFIAILCVASQAVCNDLQTLHIPAPSVNEMMQADKLTKQQKVDYLMSHKNNFDFSTSLNIWIQNQMYQGWLAHLWVVGLVGNIEMVALYLFYRKAYRPPLDYGTDH